MELKPCPFCGEKAKIGSNFEGQFFVWCTNDDCDARIFSRNRGSAIEAWNRRTPAVDAAPVVRCAYCKHCFDLSNDPMEPYDGESEWYCERFDRDTSAYEIDPYRFFCADGERRDGYALSGR